MHCGRLDSTDCTALHRAQASQPAKKETEKGLGWATADTSQTSRGTDGRAERRERERTREGDDGMGVSGGEPQQTAAAAAAGSDPIVGLNSIRPARCCSAGVLSRSIHRRCSSSFSTLTCSRLGRKRLPPPCCTALHRPRPPLLRCVAAANRPEPSVCLDTLPFVTHSLTLPLAVNWPDSAPSPVPFPVSPSPFPSAAMSDAAQFDESLVRSRPLTGQQACDRRQDCNLWGTGADSDRWRYAGSRGGSRQRAAQCSAGFSLAA
jgi:hypothetical protein